ncbi:sulfur carrier protein ThiS [Staphylococcus massiliensis]|uniref:Thiamine biosynthesis protein ThiS n=1 Tax=Staphylococcus massiliensis S46 TaxID=1229783 RepID=K9B1A0_9STAP|nr:sulfur carrier protein ThiS [Staphylococcus massiliensis]EKU48607.1 thiamine biosynthesis protein ThiS [Staphylococcus massiliensis S46]MCG3400253.1 sulfur carrier protein ThiS [Staphylococcus massiliensis]MCG3401883.1 sulfur carrier protein ThiS [Staphylococcus massiliensis]MCG3413136.1 sulfur carrier protein ThiS [Staphylococcus massiliensis]PNZ98452.1 thiamine biosynthesis protein ThiS [Staphylococcus massiliensis CCUG 55927]
MKVQVNGETHEFQEGTTISDIIDHFNIESKRMAVELNEQVIKRSEWSERKIEPNDKLELLEFVGGG